MSSITVGLVEPEFHPVTWDQASALSTTVSQRGGCRGKRELQAIQGSQISLQHWERRQAPEKRPLSVCPGREDLDSFTIIPQPSLTGLEVGSPRSRCQQLRCPVMVHSQPSSHCVLSGKGEGEPRHPLPRHKL